jgi:hypothetical protein
VMSISPQGNPIYDGPKMPPLGSRQPIKRN